MTPADIEQALLAWATTLTGATGTPPVFAMETTGVRVSLHTNVGSDDLPGAHPMIIFGCPEDGKVLEHLYTPVVRVCVSTPLLSGNFDDAGTIATHRALSALVRGWFADANMAALNTALQTVTSNAAGLSDWYPQSTTESRGKNSQSQPAWQYECPVKLCVGTS